MTTNMELLAHHVEHWAKERGLDNPENSTAQALKLFEEAGELAQAHLKKRDDEGKDAVGDILVVLTIYCQQKGWSIAECFQMAWNEIITTIIPVSKITVWQALGMDALLSFIWPVLSSKKESEEDYSYAVRSSISKIITCAFLIWLASLFI